MNILDTHAYDKWGRTFAFELVSRRPIKCKYCRRSYKYIRSFKLHMKETHMNKKRWIVPNEQTVMSVHVPKKVRNLTGTIRRRPADIDPTRKKPTPGTLLRRIQACGTHKGTRMNQPQFEDLNRVYATQSTSSKPTRNFSVIIPNPNC